MRRGLGQAASDQSSTVATLQSQQDAQRLATKLAEGGTAPKDSGTSTTTMPDASSTTVASDSSNAQLIAGQNANKVQTVSTSSTNAILYGVGALAVGGVVAFAWSRRRHGRRRR